MSLGLSTRFPAGRYRIVGSPDRFDAGDIVEIRPSDARRPDGDGHVFVYGTGHVAGTSSYVHHSNLELVRADDENYSTEDDDTEDDNEGNCDCGDCSNDGGEEYDAGFYRITQTHRNSQGREIERGSIGQLRENDTSDSDGEIQLEYTDGHRRPLRWTNVNHIEYLGCEPPAPSDDNATPSHSFRVGDRVVVRPSTDEPRNDGHGVRGQGIRFGVVYEVSELRDGVNADLIHVREVGGGELLPGIFHWRFERAPDSEETTNVTTNTDARPLRAGDRVVLKTHAEESRNVTFHMLEQGDVYEITGNFSGNMLNVRNVATSVQHDGIYAWRFKLAQPDRLSVGDRVRSLVQLGASTAPGDEGEITSTDTSTIPYLVRFPGITRWMSHDQVELAERRPAPTAAEPAQPVVGGKVRFLSSNVQGASASVGDEFEILTVAPASDDRTFITTQTNRGGHWGFYLPHDGLAVLPPTPAEIVVGSRVRVKVHNAARSNAAAGDLGTVTSDRHLDAPDSYPADHSRRFAVQMDVRRNDFGNVQQGVGPLYVFGLEHIELVVEDAKPEPTDAHAADIATISRLLAAEAVRRNWCSEYDGFIAAVNPHLNVKIVPREQDFTIDLGNLGSYTVKAISEDEARKKIRDHLMSTFAA